MPLAECTADHSKMNFQEVALRLLQQVPPDNGSFTYTQESHVFHLLISDGITYLCISAPNTPGSVPLGFLAQVKKEFTDTFGNRIFSGKSMSFDNEFRPAFKKLMVQPRGDGDRIIGQIQKEVSEAKVVMEKTIDKAIARGERLEVLQDRSENVKAKSVIFTGNARAARRHFCCQNVKFTVMVSLLVALVIFIIIVYSCGGFKFPDCK